MEQKDIIIVIMFILIIYCIYKINNMEKMVSIEGSTDTLTVKNLKIGDGTAGKTWTINVNDGGALDFKGGNGYLNLHGNTWIKDTLTLPMGRIEIGPKWVAKLESNNDEINYYHNDIQKMSLKNHNFWAHNIQ